jgi:hypothetical protein
MVAAAEVIQRMPNATTQTPPKPKKQTWRDWMPEGAPEPETLITREELIAEVQRVGESVDIYDIRNWQRDRIIPYGIRRWHDGAMRSLYPRGMTEIITSLRALQRAGDPLAAIALPLRVLAQTALPDGNATMHANAGTATATGGAAGMTSERREAVAAASIAVIPDDLVHHLATWADDHARTFRTNIVRVDVSLIDENGHPLTFRVAAGEHRQNQEPLTGMHSPTAEEMRQLRQQQRASAPSTQ